ncbi:hypothetical protein C7271_13840 [filamentous cyanobacterium CCP5]|nr:hypothetical protein C7271_13840 [filamentous cyanobacterium CCP5]
MFDLKLVPKIMRKSLIWRMILPVLVSIVVVLGAAAVNAQRSGSVAASGSPLLINKLRESEAIVRPEAIAYMIWTTGTSAPHEVWYRISGGDALFRQRLRVYKENAPPRAENTLPPESERVQELSSNNPTGWYILGPERGTFSYYFDGDHRRSGNSWENDEGITVTQITYENGTLYRIGFEDRVILDDYNDLIVEVALIQE